MMFPGKIRKQSQIVFRSVLAGFFILAVSACSAPGSPSIPTITPVRIEVVQPAQSSNLPATAAPAALQQAAPTATPAPLVTETALPASDPGDNTIFHGPLSVIITQPADGAEVQTGTVTLEGQADPETVINIGDQILVVDAGRKFSVPLAMAEGPNIIEITASDPDGNQATGYLTLTYSP